MSKDELFDDVYVVLGQMHHRSDKTNKHIKMICLEGMQNLSKVHEWSWDGMTLANLYHQLYEATNPRKDSISGYLCLLVIVI